MWIIWIARENDRCVDPGLVKSADVIAVARIGMFVFVWWVKMNVFGEIN